MAFLAALPAAVAIGLATLGPSSPAGAVEATAVPSPKARYIQRADEICAAGKNRMRAALEANEKRTGFAGGTGGRARKVLIGSPDSIAVYVAAVLPEIEAQISQLALVPAPQADRPIITELLKDTRAAIAEAKKNPRQVAYDDPFHDLGKRYRAYGFQQCGTSDRPWL